MTIKRIRLLLVGSLLAALAATGASPTTAAANVCADYNGGYFARWQAPVNTMLINELTYEAQFDKTKVRARIMDGADTWNREINNCGFSVSAKHAIAVGPGAFAGVHERPDGNRFNGVSQIAFGPIRGYQWGACDTPGILACAPVKIEGGYITEADIQFHMPLYWWGGREAGNPGNASDEYVPGGWYDLWGLAAHEFGHTLGLDHANNAGTNLTMRPQFCSGSDYNSCAPYGGSSANARTLGGGDIHHYRTNYSR